MPLKEFILRHIFKRINFVFIPLFFLAIGLFLPTSVEASGVYRLDSGGQCWLDVGTTSGGTTSYPVARAFCGGGGNGACAVFERPQGGDCVSAYVPGSGSSPNCAEGGEMFATYLRDSFGNPVGFKFGTSFTEPESCGAKNWSDGGLGRSQDLNIEFFIEGCTSSKPSDCFTELRHSSKPNNSEYYKIRNGNEKSGNIGINGVKEQLQDTTKPQSFIIYPNCAGLNDAIENDCYRTATLLPDVIDADPPRCTVTTSVEAGQNRINILAWDRPEAQSGIKRYGIYYRQASATSGGTAIVPNNGILNPAQNNTNIINTSLSRSDPNLNLNVPYEVHVNVWDVKGDNLYTAGFPINSNYYQCRTLLPCQMPPVQVTSGTCTPNVNYVDPHNVTVGTVHNLNSSANNYCQVDYVDITPGTYSSSNPNQIFESQGYANDATDGVSSKAIPRGFYWGAIPYEMTTGARTYSIRYYDSETSQHSYGTFTTPRACNPPTTPRIDATPECKIPYVAGDPNLYKRDLEWTRPSTLGDSFYGYDIQVAKDNTSNIVYTPTLSSNGSSAQEKATIAATWVPEVTAGSTYYYRVRAKSYGGNSSWTSWSSKFLLSKPTSATNFRATGVNNGTPTINLNWNYSNTSAPNNAFFSWNLSRSPVVTGVGTATFSGPTTSYSDTRGLSQAGRCDNTNYTYTLTGSNTCGSGPSTQTVGNCPANLAPTCGPIQYSINGGSNWSNYPTGSGGLTRDKNTAILLRRQCSDPEGNTIRYRWLTSFNCGEFVPADSGANNTTTYVFPDIYNASCDLTSRVNDSNSNFAPDADVVAKTFPAANLGSRHRFELTGANYIERRNTQDSYEVNRNYATMIYRIDDYINPTGQGSTTNRPLTLSIDTSSTNTTSGVLNICRSGVANCIFTLNNTTTLNTQTEDIARNTGDDIALTIRITFRDNYVSTVKEILRDTANTSSRFGIRVTASATSANNAAITPVVINGTPPIRNNDSLCQSVTFTNVPAGSAARPNVGISINARDDWGLRDYRIRYANTNSPSSFTQIVGYTGFTNNPRGATATRNWNVTGLASGRYNVHIDIRDLDGRTATCTAAQSSGDEGGGSTPPVIKVDTAVPQCGVSSMVVNSTGTQIRFDTTGTDPTSGGTFGGLASLALSYQPGATGAFTPFKTVALNGSQTIRYNNSAASDWINLSSVPGGPSVYRAVWTDAAGNVSANCDATYVKGSRISGRVFMNVGTDGNVLRDLRFQPGGAGQFDIETHAGGTVLDAGWNAASGSGTGRTRCTASYPGTAHSDTSDICSAYFISSTEFLDAGTKVVRLNVGTLAGSPTIGKYRCKMDVVEAGITRQTAYSDGANGVCSITVANTSFTHGGIGLNDQTEWPTQVNFTLDYNSDQIMGSVYTPTGADVGSGYSVSTNGNTASTVSSGNYVSPATASPDNSANYTRNVGANRSATVVLNTPGSDPERLCVWAYKSDFSTMTQRASGTLDNQFSSAAKVQDIAQDLSLSGWQVGASAACSAAVNLAQNNVSDSQKNRLSPKYQHQVNFMHLPKVKITGTIYYLNDDNQCGSTSGWSNPTNQATGTVPVRLDFNTAEPSAAELDNFYNPQGPADAEGFYSYNTGDTFEFYANSLPGTDWNNWRITRDLNLDNTPNGAAYTVCGDNGTITPSSRIGSYPNEFEITADIGVYIRETNDWWQTYNGGVHGQAAIVNDIPEPASTNLVGESASIEVHELIGNPTVALYKTAGNIISIRTPFTNYFAGGLVSSQGNLPIGLTVGDRNWSYISTNMKPVRIPYTTNETDVEVSAIRRIQEARAGDSSLWNGGNNEFTTGTKNVNSDIDFTAARYMVVDNNISITADIINSSNTNPLFIIADGNVTIGRDVERIDAIIYASGNITVESYDADTSQVVPIKVYGGLYATGDVIFQRDMENTLNNFGYPSEQVIFNPRLIINSRRDANFPKELKESNVYWTQVE